MPTLTADVVIVGAGLAGASTAYALSRRGVRQIVVVEQERRAGLAASGHSAGLGCQTATPPEMLPLAVETMRFLAAPPEGFPHGDYLRRHGSVLLAEGAAAVSLKTRIHAFRLAGLDVDWLDRQTVEQLVPPTDGGSFEGGLFCREDGVVEVSALLGALLRASKAKRLLGRRVTGIETAAGRVSAVVTDHGERIESPAVVNAAGAWAGEVAQLAGAAPIALRPTLGHVTLTGPLEWADPAWPFVWDLNHQVCFRPEFSGLLLWPIEAVDHPPGEVTVDDEAIAAFVSRLERWLPRLAGIPIERSWAGQRTAPPDGACVIGVDPEVQGFVWCAGLGGYGVTTCVAVGRLTAGAIAGETVPEAHWVGRLVGRSC
jgi:D-arginine dehydrogenase